LAGPALTETTVTDPEAGPLPSPKGLGRIVLLGTLLGLVLIPCAVFFVMEIVNLAVFECYDNGAEGSLSCTLRQLAVTGLSIPPGGIIGLLVAVRIGEKRADKTPKTGDQ
jgi:hypothetical protein